MLSAASPPARPQPNLAAASAGKATYVQHHKQKIALLFSAMRHFAAELREEGIAVDYVRLDDPANTRSFTGELTRAVQRHRPDVIVATEPGEWRVWEMMLGWRETMSVPVYIRDDNRFLCSPDAFARWSAGRKQGRMEFFYRDMRRRTGLLMDAEEPVGGRWNFDAENRTALPAGHRPPPRLAFAPDAMTREVLDLVGHQFSDHFGNLDSFHWAVTRADALRALDHFIAYALPGFGDWQDAMNQGEDFPHHAIVAPYLNRGGRRGACPAAKPAARRE